MNNVKLPVGISDFHKLRQNEYYYVDKTNLIKELLESRIAEVTLITRPRRFGKTIGMSMLAYFFDIRKDSRKLFEDLKISRDIELCQKWMNQYPTLFISFKDVDGLNFQSAMKMLRNQISWICNEHDYLSDSDKVNENDKKIFLKLQDISEENLSEDLIKISVATIIRMMNAHYGKPVILLLDEYDVPLAKANSNGYYKEMLDVMKTMMSTSLKDNSHLQFAVVTGCLKIAKESIFTGTNNFISDTIISTHLNEYFGFTDQEVKDILKDIGLQEHFKEIKEWYDGYNFGKIDVYCPWDVIQYCKSLYLDVSAKPQDFWSNSSGNAIVRRFIDKADISTRNEIERLIAGESIEKDVVSELTYDEIDKSIENLWSVLFTTGYLTHKGCTESGKYRLVIPNKEVRNLFVKKIREWFSDVSRNDGKTLEEFCSAFVDKDSEKIEQIFGDYLWNTISIRDTAVAKEKKENFYHGILLGLLGYKSNWLIKSNAESGIGYSDILVEVPTNRTGIVIEIKYAEDGDLDAACEKALKQIEEKDYVAKLKQDGMKNFIKYGVACFKKICKVEIE